MTDRILRIEAATGPHPDNVGSIAHVRAVEIAASSGAFYPHTASEDVPAAAASLGITTIEIMLQTAGEYAPDFARLLASHANDAGVRIHSLHTMDSLHPFLNAYPRRVLEAHDMFLRAIEAAQITGARVLVWHGPRRDQVRTDDDWSRFIELTADLAARCGEAGVTLGLENVSRCALAHVRDFARFARHLDDLGPREQLGFVFDPFQAAEAGANPFMIIAAMGNRIVNVHISDMDNDRPTERHLPPGDGDLPWSALIRAIASSGYTGPMMIEGPLGTDDAAIGRVRNRLNPLIRSVFPFPPDAAASPEVGNPPGACGTLPDGVRAGIALFNQRRFFEQHEVIEHEWHAERGPIRALYQGILQIGVGLYHALNGNQRGAVSVLTDGIAKTSAFQPTALGINTGRLVTEAQACLEEIIALGPDHIADFDASRMPTIELDAD